jgi:TatD DNase family protein
LLIDTHAHLNMADFDPDREAVVKRATEANVGAILDVGTDAASSRKAVTLSKTYSAVFAAAGVHPHEASKISDDDFRNIESLLAETKVVAVGEIGLDYHYRFSPEDVQQRVFRKQIEIGRMFHKPMIIHVREAMPDALRILEEMQSFEYRGVFHCYGGSKQDIPKILDMGFHVSFTGVVTFNNFKQQDMVAAVPLDRLLLETDSPYMTPVPFRGRRNEPAFIIYTAKRLAEIHRISPEWIVDQTTANAKSLFGLE